MSDFSRAQPHGCICKITVRANDSYHFYHKGFVPATAKSEHNQLLLTTTVPVCSHVVLLWDSYTVLKMIDNIFPSAWQELTYGPPSGTIPSNRLREIQSACSVRGGRTLEAGSFWDGVRTIVKVLHAVGKNKFQHSFVTLPTIKVKEEPWTLLLERRSELTLSLTSSAPFTFLPDPFCRATSISFKIVEKVMQSTEDCFSS
ncbi:hypothetical protein Anapl_18246 [Anas platyrhynchos]|uniref:Uncharacterized protein n=1 Tax=Anas platyrhynchos TaxID=8839 RepID=R0L8G8_ANAPL|nr:hypothetical protein Anapl_18246 [Anas platyrhynchos]